MRRNQWKKEQTEKIKAKSWFFEKINKINNLLDGLIKKKERKHRLLKSGMKEGLLLQCLLTLKK